MEAASSGRQLTPLGKGGGAVEFAVFVAVEVTFLVEDPTGTDCDPRYRVVSQHDPECVKTSTALFLLPMILPCFVGRV